MDKKKTTKILWIIFALILIAIIVYFVVNHFKGTIKLNKLDNSGGSTPVKNNALGGFSDTVNTSRILHKGDTGNTVSGLQKAINSKIITGGFVLHTLQVDGIYGPLTEDAIKEISNSQLQSGFDNVSIDNINAL
jgi:hypothetical protein